MSDKVRPLKAYEMLANLFMSLFERNPDQYHKVASLAEMLAWEDRKVKQCIPRVKKKLAADGYMLANKRAIKANKDPEIVLNAAGEHVVKDPEFESPSGYKIAGSARERKLEINKGQQRAFYHLTSNLEKLIAYRQARVGDGSTVLMDNTIKQIKLSAESIIIPFPELLAETKAQLSIPPHVIAAYNEIMEESPN